ncbi:hypothetical protein [uncultured Lacinutrix sp.]|uniref:hypothetical protein n=1 Tax=uncultured Lacinutrix sp. TaxID=574032 RepID=UPI00261BDCB8|nr:hypothetical protein [uncultured Lacinutrix sp.]
MKKLNKIIVLIVLSIVLTNCATVKLSNTWSSEDFQDAKTKKVLVVARSNDKEVQKAYENELVSKLKNEDINAISAHKLFPDLKEKSNRSQEEINTIVKDFSKEGIQSILLTALKGTKVEESIPEKEDTNASSIVNRGRYGFTFTDYYNVHSIEYLSRDLRPNYNENDQVSSQLLSSTTYTLEAVFYDLTLEKDKQFTGFYEVKITDPSSAKQILKKFSNIIIKQFKK